MRSEIMGPGYKSKYNNKRIALDLAVLRPMHHIHPRVPAHCPGFSADSPLPERISMFILWSPFCEAGDSMPLSLVVDGDATIMSRRCSVLVISREGPLADWLIGVEGQRG
jgi:hypothetical protein